ncbi:DcuS/MalK family sensor histidine kinase [Paenibacillus donghaensis]|uniref:histidine kinase n=1 Tax=Paenibacillus donghaensis TaxID=414771 RepID=A0A2Z2KGQ1_9BACL|nr:DcuS/MalK family sensor histidine kinase [Paenibacillus donghaensis]ASA20002.1 two-component system sensor histidine kinase DcuS [Paenibacillus donghaensis]
MFRKKRIYGLRTTVTLMVCGVVMLVLLVLYAVFSSRLIPQPGQALEEKAVAIARTIALVPLISDGLSKGDSKAIQAYTSKITRRNDIMFVVVTDMNSIRYSHPDATLIGLPFVGGKQEQALQGEESFSEGQGPLGKSLRAFVPVFNGKGNQVGLVIVGLSQDRVKAITLENKWTIIAILLSGAVLGAAGAIVLARKIKKMIFWMEPLEISKLLEERSAMLQSTREGIIAVDHDARVTLINLEAERLLRVAGICEEVMQQPIVEIWPGLQLETVLASGEGKQDQEIDLNGITLLANSLPIRVNGSTVGAIVTFRDKTEITQLAERLSGISVYADALRAGAHEFMNKLHVIMGMTHMGLYDDLQEYISGTVVNYQNEIGSITRQIKDPVMAGFLLGKLSRTREAGISLLLDEDCYLPGSEDPAVIHELITIVGNLIDNSIDAMKDAPDKVIRLVFRYDNGYLVCMVQDKGPGIDEALREKIYTQGFSTKGENRGMGLYLVRRSVDKLNGRLELLPPDQSGATFVASVQYNVKDDEI